MGVADFGPGTFVFRDAGRAFLSIPVSISTGEFALLWRGLRGTCFLRAAAADASVVTALDATAVRDPGRVAVGAGLVFIRVEDLVAVGLGFEDMSV